MPRLLHTAAAVLLPALRALCQRRPVLAHSLRSALRQRTTLSPPAFLPPLCSLLTLATAALLVCRPTPLLVHAPTTARTPTIAHAPTALPYTLSPPCIHPLSLRAHLTHAVVLAHRPLPAFMWPSLAVMLACRSLFIKYFKPEWYKCVMRYEKMSVRNRNKLYSELVTDMANSPQAEKHGQRARTSGRAAIEKSWRGHCARKLEKQPKGLYSYLVFGLQTNILFRHQVNFASKLEKSLNNACNTSEAQGFFELEVQNTPWGQNLDPM
ncbi:hypothetical protein C8R45DRAFT_930272 [Mycena sanguinolenta]|nr:hypothetical protein C8R45DRAFT_930272 [Mycena sanguinolenta]